MQAAAVNGLSDKVSVVARDAALLERGREARREGVNLVVFDLFDAGVCVILALPDMQERGRSAKLTGGSEEYAQARSVRAVAIPACPSCGHSRRASSTYLSACGITSHVGLYPTAPQRACQSFGVSPLTLKT